MSVIYRVLLDTDPYCPQCGHNRDKSSVSTIDCGLGIKECQMCNARWIEVDDDAEANCSGSLKGSGE